MWIIWHRYSLKEFLHYLFYISHKILQIRNATASRDGKLIAAVFANCSTVVYDSSLHNQLASFQGFFPVFLLYLFCVVLFCFVCWYTAAVLFKLIVLLQAGAVALSATGDKVASGGYDGSTTVWQVAAPHEQLFRFDGCDEGVSTHYPALICFRFKRFLLPPTFKHIYILILLIGASDYIFARWCTAGIGCAG